MTPDEIVSLFDQRAAGYDRRWAKTARSASALSLLSEPMFPALAPDARLLGVGTGGRGRIWHAGSRGGT